MKCCVKRVHYVAAESNIAQCPLLVAYLGAAVAGVLGIDDRLGFRGSLWSIHGLIQLIRTSAGSLVMGVDAFEVPISGRSTVVSVDLDPVARAFWSRKNTFPASASFQMLFCHFFQVTDNLCIMRCIYTLTGHTLHLCPDTPPPSRAKNNLQLVLCVIK